MSKFDMLKISGWGKIARSIEPFALSGAVRGGEDIGLIGKCLMAVKLSWQDMPRCIEWEALMVKLGSLRVGEDSTVRHCGVLL